MGSFCGSGPQTVIQTQSNPNVTAQQNQIYSQVNDYASRFGGDPSQLVAPWNGLETQAAQGVADSVNSNAPWINMGEGMVGQGSNMAAFAPDFYGQGASTVAGVNPISGQAWNPTPYESPFNQDVIDATRANIEQSNAVAQNSALGTAIQSGNAFGGDRAGIAMGELARNQGLAENQTIAALEQANFNQASQQANAQQQYGLNLGQANNAQQLQAAGMYGQFGQGMTQAGLGQGNLGYQLGNLANLGQQSELGAWQGLYNMGVGLQGTQQQQLSAPLTFGQWYGNASPGVQNVPTSTTYPGSSPLSTIAGLGIGAAGIGSILSDLGPLAFAAASRGGRIGKDGGGSVDGSHDLVNRYHSIKRALGGGAQNQTPGAVGMGADPGAYTQAILGQTPQARQMPTAENFALQRYLGLSRGAGDTKDPALQEADIQQIATPQAARGGAIRRDDGGGVSIGDAWSANTGDDVVASVPTVDPPVDQHSRYLDSFDRLAKLLHKAVPQQQQQDPTKAPHAPNATSWDQIAKMAGGLGSLGGMGSNDTGWIAEAGSASRGGRTIGDMGRKHFDSGGSADDVGDPAAYSAYGNDIGTISDLWRRIVPPDQPKPQPEANPHQSDEAAMAASFPTGRDIRLPPIASNDTLTDTDRAIPALRDPYIPGVQASYPGYQNPEVGQPGTVPQRAWDVAGQNTGEPDPRTRSLSSPAMTAPPAGNTAAPPDKSAAIAQRIQQLRLKALEESNSPQSKMLAFAAGFLGQGRDAHGLPASFLQQAGGGFGAVLQQRQQNLSALQEQAKIAMAEAKTPAEIEQIKAHTKVYEVEADKEFKLKLQEQLLAYQKQLEMQQKEQYMAFLREMQRGAAGPLAGTGSPVGAGVHTWHGPGQLTPDQ